jgi:hypothetical protein
MRPDTHTVPQLFELDVRYFVSLYQHSFAWNLEKQWEPMSFDLARPAW